jgi:hypothetical protein
MAEPVAAGDGLSSAQRRLTIERGARAAKRRPQLRRVVTTLAVLIAIGSCFAVPVPNFIRFNCRSRKAEAKTMLKSIQVNYRAAINEEPRRDWSEGWKPTGSYARYRYGFTVQDGEPVFLAVAELPNGADAWLADERTMRNVADGCR